MQLLIILISGAVVAVAMGAWLAWNRPGVQAYIAAKQGIPIITDLDAILNRTVGFKFKGRVHRIPPLPVERFMLAMNALAQLEMLREKDKVNEKELLSAYEGVFSIVCPSITRRHIEDMTVQQIAALLNMIIGQIMGRSQLESEKKSTSKPMKEGFQKTAV